MIQFLTDALKSPAGSFAFIFAILMLAFWATYQISKWMTRLKHVDKLDQNVSVIKDDISIIKAFITVFREANNPFARAQSPVALTEKGIEVARDLDVQNLISRHWEDINKDIVNSIDHDCNPYDIQQEAINVASKIQKYLTPSELDLIKRYAYQHGHTLATYDLLFGVHIRDIYFKNNKINIADVDKYDPNKKK